MILLDKNELNSNCEDVWLKIPNDIGNNVFIVGVIYRHSEGNVNNFLTAHNKKLVMLSYKQCYLFGDFNVNLFVPKLKYLEYFYKNLEDCLVNIYKIFSD